MTEKREIPFVCNNERHTANKEENSFHEFFYEYTVLLRINARGVYLFFLFLGGAFIRGRAFKRRGRLLNYLSLA